MDTTDNEKILTDWERIKRLTQQVTDAHAIAELRKESLLELERAATDLRNQAAMFHTVTSDRLEVFVANLGHLAEGLARAARGYTEVDPDDISYPGIIDELNEHNWGMLSEVELDRRLADLAWPLDDRPRRGHLRGMPRGDQLLLLWFTAPDTLSAGYSSEAGELFDVREIHAVIASRPGIPIERQRIEVTRGWSCPVPFDVPFDHVGDGLRVAYWAGAIVDSFHLTRLTNLWANHG